MNGLASYTGTNTATIYRSISIFNIIFNISASTRSPRQWNKCLRFGRASKFYPSKTKRIHHCGDNKQSIDSYFDCQILSNLVKSLNLDGFSCHLFFSRFPHSITSPYYCNSDFQVTVIESVASLGRDIHFFIILIFDHRI